MPANFLFRRLNALALRVKSALFEVDGNVESAMVMIPLILTFLAVLQISSYAISHGVLSNAVSGEISQASMLTSHNPDAFNPIGFDRQIRRIALPGGGAILIKSVEGNSSYFAPILIGRSKFTSTGISIDEN
jgi:hypothetical protein